MSEFFHMGGYGFYVWTVYGLAAAVLIANVVVPAARRRRMLRELGRELASEERVS